MLFGKIESRIFGEIYCGSKVRRIKKEKAMKAAASLAWPGLN